MSIYLYRSIYTHTDNRTALGNLVILVVFDLFHLNLGQTTSAVRPTRWREKNTNTHSGERKTQTHTHTTPPRRRQTSRGREQQGERERAPLSPSSHGHTYCGVTTGYSETFTVSRTERSSSSTILWRIHPAIHLYFRQ